MEAVFGNFIEDWDQASGLPKELRVILNNACPLDIKATVLVGKENNSLKAAIQLEDGNMVETVLMRHNDGRNTVCLSTQAGCPLKCDFCATGRLGFKRNLAAEEILEQIIFMSRILKKENSRVTNAVFMGMGEPFLNYDNVMSAIKIINDKNYFNIGARKISVSTAGIIPGIEKFAKEPLQVNLAISLHAPTDELRDKLMPINRTYPLKKLISAIKKYTEKTNRKVMLEYILLSNVNDSQQNAEELIKTLDPLSKKLFVINVIPCNPTQKYKQPSAEKIKKFKDVLSKAGLNTVERYEFGRDIRGACGQLAGKVKAS